MNTEFTLLKALTEAIDNFDNAKSATDCAYRECHADPVDAAVLALRAATSAESHARHEYNAAMSDARAHVTQE